jgi:hypothetical protein
MGWGDTDPTDEIVMASSTLRQVNLNIISNVDCEDSTDGGGINYEGQITNNMICAHDVKGGGKDACQVRNFTTETNLFFFNKCVFLFFFVSFVLTHSFFEYILFVSSSLSLRVILVDH